MKKNMRHDKKGKKKKRKYITLKQLCKEIDELIAICKTQMKKLERPASKAVPRGKSKDGRWTRLTETEIPTDCPKFWKTYESLTGRDRRFWLNYVQQKMLQVGGFPEDLDANLISKVDDFWALWEACREFYRWNNSLPQGQASFVWGFEPGERPLFWWFGAIHGFIKIDKEGDMHLLQPQKQTQWLRGHGYLSPAEERVLKERKQDPKHPHDLTDEEELEALDWGIELNERGPFQHAPNSLKKK